MEKFKGMESFMRMYACIYETFYITQSAQGWRNRTLIGHERAIVHFLVMPGSDLSITEIPEYTYFSLI